MKIKGILKTLSAYLNHSRIGDLLVIKDLITPDDLRHALSTQKVQKQPLGKVLVSQGVISKSQLRFVLGQQLALRTIATMAFCLLTLGTVASKKTNASGIKDIPVSFALKHDTGAAYGGLTSFPALYGTSEKRSGNISAFTKWIGMFERFELEMKASSSKPIIREWHENLKSFENMPLKEMASKVNSLMNQRDYILDSKNWGKSDYWATPIEFMRRGGDCEDFAIAKYAALRSLGVPEERLRMAIVHDTVKDIPHAVLVVYTEQGAYVLDNQEERIQNAASAGRYRPIFSINRLGWWLHTEAEATVVASLN